MDQFSVVVDINNLIHVHVVFNYLIAKHSQLALVVDEYGDVQGLITLEDIFEHLTGKEIVDETDQTLSLKQLARERWKAWKSKHSIIEVENDEQKLKNVSENKHDNEKVNS